MTMKQTGATSDTEAERQVAAVCDVYAGKSETPESGARTTQYEIGRTVSVTYHCATHGDWDALRASGCPECVRQMRGEIRALEKEAVRLLKELAGYRQIGWAQKRRISLKNWGEWLLYETNLPKEELHDNGMEVLPLFVLSTAPTEVADK